MNGRKVAGVRCQVAGKKKLRPALCALPHAAAPFRPAKERLRELTKPVMIQVAPGKWMADQDKTPPDYTVAEWHKNGDGSYTPVPAAGKLVRVTSRLVRELGFTGQWCTLRRLWRAGFVEMLQIAPNTTLINLDSYYNHLRRVAEDPDFWERGKPNFEHYRAVMLEVR